MKRSLRPALLRQWVPGIASIGLLLTMPATFERLQASLDPFRERREIAWEAEREQRARGTPYVTAAGETVRAVVHSPTSPTQAEEDARRRSLVWWCRVLAALIALGLVARTWETVRRSNDTLTQSAA